MQNSGDHGIYGYSPYGIPEPYRVGYGYAGYPDSRRGGERERTYPGDTGTGAAAGPLRVIHVNLAMFPAGIDKWLTALVRHCDPTRLRFLRCVVTSEFVDWKQLLRVGLPVEIGRGESIRRACEDCDVLMISDPGEDPDWVEQVRAKLCVLVAHGDGPWTRARMERLAPVIHHVVAVSKQVERTVCAGFPCTVIPNGVDPQHLARSRPRHEVRAALGFGPADFVAGFVGRFAHEKNPLTLVDAVARLPQRFKLLLVGYGPLHDEILERAGSLIPGRFAIIRGEDYMGDLYAAMDAFCLASHSEGYGLAIMEAMMCGKPVVVGSVGLVPDMIVNRKNGVVIRGDAESISEALSQLEAENEWAAAIGREALSFADQHGFASTMAARYAALLEALWAARSKLEVVR
jgi:glycosyltransferase involved in cell wall biosynthesis